MARRDGLLVAGQVADAERDHGIAERAVAEQVKAGSHGAAHHAFDGIATEDGLEMTFAVNHLGHFLLANLLVEDLQAPGRIIFVASGTHNDEIFTGMPKPRYVDFPSLARGDIGGPEEPAGKRGRRLYSTSKLCNVYCAYEMARRLEHRAPGITVNAFDPGLMPGTGLAREYGPVQRWMWKYVAPALRPFHPMISSVRRSGRGLARLASDPELGELNGTYYLIDRPGTSSARAKDQDEQARLWQTSLELTNLTA